MSADYPLLSRLSLDAHSSPLSPPPIAISGSSGYGGTVYNAGSLPPALHSSNFNAFPPPPAQMTGFSDDEYLEYQRLYSHYLAQLDQQQLLEREIMQQKLIQQEQLQREREEYVQSQLVKMGFVSGVGMSRQSSLPSHLPSSNSPLNPNMHGNNNMRTQAVGFLKYRQTVREDSQLFDPQLIQQQLLQQQIIQERIAQQQILIQQLQRKQREFELMKRRQELMLQQQLEQQQYRSQVNGFRDLELQQLMEQQQRRDVEGIRKSALGEVIGATAHRLAMHSSNMNSPLSNSTAVEEEKDEGFTSPITKRNTKTGWHAATPPDAGTISADPSDGAENYQNPVVEKNRYSLLSLFDDDDYVESNETDGDFYTTLSNYISAFGQSNYAGLASLDRISAILRRKEEELKLSPDPSSDFEKLSIQEKEVVPVKARKDALAVLGRRLHADDRDTLLNTDFSIDTTPSLLTPSSPLSISPMKAPLSPFRPSSFESRHTRSLSNISNSSITPLSGLLHRGPAFQVITLSTVKDRHLFLYPTVLVIAKEILPGAVIPELNNTTSNDSLFYPKSVLSLSTLQIRDERPVISIYDSPEINKSVQEFNQNPIACIAKLVATKLVSCTPDSIAQYLHNPMLSRKQLGIFLAVHPEVLAVYLDYFQFKNMGLLESIRMVLSVVKIPGDIEVIDAIMESVARKWYAANKSIVRDPESLVIQIAKHAILLNANIRRRGHNHHPTIFDTVVNEFTGQIYTDLVREKLSMVADKSGGTPIQVECENLARVTINAPSLLISIKIPSPDPNLRLVVGGKDLQVTPTPILEFSASAVARFRIRGTVLGKTTMVVTKLGASSANYEFMNGGQVFVKQVVVEKPFLRYTFQLIDKEKTYMFSVPDGHSKREWVKWLSRVEGKEEGAGWSSESVMKEFKKGGKGGDKVVGCHSVESEITLNGCENVDGVEEEEEDQGKGIPISVDEITRVVTRVTGC